MTCEQACTLLPISLPVGQHSAALRRAYTVPGVCRIIIYVLLRISYLNLHSVHNVGALMMLLIHPIS